MSSYVFIDSRVANFSSILAGIAIDVVTVALDPDQDGLEQIAATLSGQTAVEAIHIISHGADGTLFLGNNVLNQANIGRYSSQLATIGATLTTDSDILLYGCNVAATAYGQAFITALALHTGADVAASMDLTGAAALGGNAVLESATGPIDTPLVLSAAAWDASNTVLVNSPPVINTNIGPTTVNLTNAAGLTFLDNATVSQSLNVSGLAGTITRISVTISGLTHAFPDDLDFLLVAPNGTNNLVFWSDVGGGNPGVSNLTVAVADAGATPMPDAAGLTAGTYRPADYAEAETGTNWGIATGGINHPQSNGTATLASVFNGLSPNGNWTLYVRDDLGVDAGSLTGWSLDITTTGSNIYTENGAAITLAPALTLSDVDNTTLASATVRISAGTFTGDGDVLAANVTGTGITATYNATTETLLLSGTDTLAHYQQVLRSVTFSSTSDNPTNAGQKATRIVDWQVNDGTPSGVPEYGAATTYDTLSQFAKCVATADLNDDGKVDLAVGITGAVLVFLGNGNGTFAAATTFPIPKVGVSASQTDPAAIVIADLNGDSKVDLATANSNTGTVSVLLGNGDGSFTTGTHFTTSGTFTSSPRTLAIADVNGDGTLDLATANYASNNLSVLLGNGDGTFAAPKLLPVGTNPRLVAVVDLNGDGKLDLVGWLPSFPYLSLLFGNGSGSFSVPTNITIGQNPQDIAIADLNSDGKLDLATVDNGAVSILLGNGNGSFSAPTKFAAGINPLRIGAIDVNSDSKLDLVVTTRSPLSGLVGFQLLLGDGSGNFAAATNFIAGANPQFPFGDFAGIGYIFGDFDGTGGPDLAVWNSEASGTSVMLNASTNFSATQRTAVTILATNDSPTLTTMASTVATEKEDVQAAIALAALKAQGNEADIDGTVDAFIVKAISSGTLLLGISPETATPWAAGVNDTVDATHQAYWKAALNANGTLNAFTVVARDNGGLESTTTPVQVTLAVTPVYDAPIIAGVAASATYDKNAPGTVLSSALTLTAVDGASTATSATVRISAGMFAGDGDVLAANVTGTSIIASYNAANETLLLTGADTLAHYQQVLRSVTFSSTSTNPTNSGGSASRVVEWQINDGAPPAVPLYDAQTTFGPGFLQIPLFVTSADFNGDGKPDLAVANGNSSVVTVLLGSGTGTFVPWTDLTTGTNPRSIAIADVNSDGKPDLAVANRDAHTVSVLLGNGNGTFTGTTSIPIPKVASFASEATPVSVSIADMNRDGKPDLLVANDNSGDVTLFLGNGNGSFDGGTNIITGSFASNPKSVAVADINGDGKPDFVVANQGANNVAVLIGNGNGTFAAATTFAAGASPTFVASADLNGDGKFDLAVANRDSNNISVLLGNGNGGFAAATNFTAGRSPVSVVIADVNGDGRLDLTAANSDTNNISVLLGNGDGSFAAATNFAAGSSPQSVAIADVDSDGTPDLVSANFNSGNVSVLLNASTNVSATQHTTVNITATNGNAGIAVRNDFSGDHKSDILWRNVDGRLSEWQMNSDSIISNAIVAATTTNQWKVVGTGDFNGDGKTDILWRHAGGSLVEWQMNGNSIASSLEVAVVSNDWKVVSTGDFNGDGKADILWRNVNGALMEWQMDGYSATSQTVIATLSNDWKVVGTGDFNGDGKTDILWRNVDGRLSEWQMDGHSVISNVVIAATTTNQWKVVGTGDFNGDGKADILWRHVGGSLVEWQMNGNSTASSLEVAVVGNDWSVIDTGDFNGDGKADILWRNVDGRLSEWQMNGYSATSQTVLATVTNDWIAFGSPLEGSTIRALDFGGDGKADILWRNVDGTLAEWQMSGASAISQAVIAAVSNDWKVIGAGDFNGDGKADLLWRNVDGTVAEWQMNGNSAISQAVIGTLTNDWMMVGTGDFNADGKADILWRNVGGRLSEWQMNGNSVMSQVVIGTVTNDWTLVGTGDFNGDGMTDIIWRNVDGRLAQWQMNGNSAISQAVVATVSNDWRVVGTGDFNGDHKSDILWRNVDGRLEEWQMNGNSTASQAIIATVTNDWKVVATGEFNGDGREDIMWRNVDGTLAQWLMNGNSAIGQAVVGTVTNDWNFQSEAVATVGSMHNPLDWAM